LIIQLDASGKQGRYVRIQLLDKNYLSLAEVQVIGVEGFNLIFKMSVALHGKQAQESSVLIDSLPLS
jgi:hypothetical protein